MPQPSKIRTRLDRAIRRLEAQRTCLDWAIREIADVPGIVLELGLGNGRTFDHLRAHMPDRQIYVFERNPQAHPASTPSPDRLIIGTLEETLPTAQKRFAGQVAFLHSDIGTGDDDRNNRFAAWLGPELIPFLAPGAIVASDQRFDALAHLAAPLPPGVDEGRYHLYRFVAPP